MIKGKTVTVGSQCIVPHNRYLICCFNCHINVELCPSIKSIKYVLKYMHKGADMAVYKLQSEHSQDEEKLYKTARYVGAQQACSRLFGLPIREHYPVLTTLPVHLKNGQRVVFAVDTALTRVQEAPTVMFTAFYALCAHYTLQECTELPADRNYVSCMLYNEVP